MYHTLRVIFLMHRQNRTKAFESSQSASIVHVQCILVGTLYIQCMHTHLDVHLDIAQH